MANERCRNIEGLCRDDFANRDVLPIELGLEQFAERPRASQPDNVMPFQSLKGEALFRYVQFLTAIKQRQFGARDGTLFQAGVPRRAVTHRLVAFPFVTVPRPEDRPVGTGDARRGGSPGGATY